jgi:hypothetical protein
MSNFGMAKELKIKFKDKDGNQLETREEYEKRINTERNRRILPTALSRSLEIQWNQGGSSDRLSQGEETPDAQGLYGRGSSGLFDHVSKRVSEVSDKISKELSDRRIGATSQKVKLSTPEEFHKAISEAKATNKNGWMVDVHEVDDYANDILLLTEDGKSGIAVTKEGDIISVFSAVSHDKRLNKLMQMAIAAGGKKLDCFYMEGDYSGLPDIYQDFGFTTDATNPLDESFLGDDYKEWVKNNPDKKVKGVAAMSLSNSNSIENFGKTTDSRTNEAPVLTGEKGYDDMIALRDKSIYDRENYKSYEDYLRENQAGIDHYEVIAPAYTKGIFEKFTDKNGNISVKALEALNPDLLKMIGYRIPTEAKYSIAPLKIVGFFCCKWCSSSYISSVVA